MHSKELRDKEERLLKAGSAEIMPFGRAFSHNPCSHDSSAGGKGDKGQI
jgi:hypothetical protein